MARQVTGTHTIFQFVILTVGVTCLCVGAMLGTVNILTDDSTGETPTETQLNNRIIWSHQGPEGGFEATQRPTTSQITVPASSSRGDGTVVTGRITVLETDDIYINVNDATVGQRFQTALQTARRAVATTPQTDSPPGFILRLDIPDRWGSIEGTSIGLATTLSLAATPTNLSLNTSITATGRVQPTGAVTAVGDIPAKVAAAANNGYKTILVPPGQTIPHPDIRVREVSSVREAANISLTADSTQKHDE